MDKNWCEHIDRIFGEHIENCAWDGILWNLCPVCGAKRPQNTVELLDRTKVNLPQRLPPTREVEIVDKKLLAPAILSVSGVFCLSRDLFTSEGQALNECAGTVFEVIKWPAIPNAQGFYEVEGEK